MTTLTVESSDTRRTAQLAGVLYLIFVILGIYGFAYVRPKIMVPNDPAATAHNMIANEFIYRTGFLASAVSTVLFIAIVLILYRLLKHVNVNQARMMVSLVIVSLPVAIMSDTLEITALRLVKGDVLTSFTTEQAQQVASILMKISGNSGQMLTLLWGLWLFPLGFLVYRSGFIPKIFGVLLVINGLGYVINNFSFLLFPEAQPTVVKFIFPTYFLGELPFTFWLLLKGVRHSR
jgi:hypothetical protein